MKTERDYVNDIAEIRSIMERSSKFLSLSGWAGILAGIYALVGAYIAHAFLGFRPSEAAYSEGAISSSELWKVCILAGAVLFFSIVTAIFLSYKRAAKREESLWNATARRLLMNMALPLATGGVLCLVFMAKGLNGLLAPLTLVFYGLALFNAGNFTFREVRVLGLIQIILGLTGFAMVGYGLLLWAVGFGLMHIVYGIFIYLKYER